MSMLRLVTVFTLCGVLGTGCGSFAGDDPADIVVFHAGSLSVPVRTIAERYESANPGVEVHLESAGSRTCARKIADLNLRCDVFLSADYMVIENLLVPKHAQWYLGFATNEIVLAYRSGPTTPQVPTSQNFVELLTDESARLARSDPDSDPAGYRTLQSVQLMETFYSAPGLYRSLIEKDQRFVRPKSADLIALLQTGAVDYAFVYRSVAAQHGIPFLEFDDAVNLGDAARASDYAQAAVAVSGMSPDEAITLRGIPILYAATIPTNAVNISGGVAFLEYFLDPERGLAMLEAAHQEIVTPAPVSGYNALPDGLKSFADTRTVEP